MRSPSRPNTAIALALGLLALPACSKNTGEPSSEPVSANQPAGPHDGPGTVASGRSAARPPMPASLRAYRAVFLPIWDSQPKTGRSARACEQFSDLQERAEAIAKTAPHGIDAATWKRARESLTLCNESISEYCDDEDIGAEDMASEQLTCIHKAVTELSAMFATSPGAEDMHQRSSAKRAHAKRAVDGPDGFAAFEAAFAPLAAQSPENSLAAACGADLFKLAMAIDPASAPAGADAAKWRAAVTSLRQDAEELSANCDDKDPAVQSLARNLLRSMTETWQSLQAMRTSE